MQLWILGSDLVLHGAFVTASLLNLVVLVLAVVLSVLRSDSVHRAGVAIAWLIFVVQSVLRGVGDLA